MRLRSQRSSPPVSDGVDGDETSQQPPLALRTAYATARASRRAGHIARDAGEAAVDVVAETAEAAVEIVAEIISNR
ncbi:MAG: hypothetical protein J2P29_09225 [Actinobacteria bacterium]|nr:hypothetical protein [Actinomycetota bacterium]